MKRIRVPEIGAARRRRPSLVGRGPVHRAGRDTAAVRCGPGRRMVFRTLMQDGRAGAPRARADGLAGSSSSFPLSTG